MAIARVIRATKDGFLEGTFGIELDSIRVFPGNEERGYEVYANRLLSQHRAFIHSMHAYPDPFDIELRYLYHPREPHSIRIYFLARMYGKTRRVLDRNLLKAHQFILHSLLINDNCYRFTPVEDRGDLRRLVQPFPFNHIAEVVRREDYIDLDSVCARRISRLGFTVNLDVENIATDARLHYVYPYIPHTDTFERLCNALSLNNQPCLVSIHIRPYALTEADVADLLSRINRCEKYSQLNLRDSSEYEKLEPPFKILSSNLHRYCSENLLELQDAAFLLKTVLVSSEEIPHELTTILGNSITRHTGDEQHAFLSQKWPFAGGYDWYIPHRKEERSAAIRSFCRMDFLPCAPNSTERKETRWRYIFDVIQTSAAFRLPIPIAGEFPGLDTLQYTERVAPSDLPGTGLLMGEHPHMKQVRKVYLSESDRLRHTYVVGQTGTGKSTLFLHMILQDIERGEGIGVMDPHGELIEAVLTSIPEERYSQVIYVNPSDYDFPVGINMLEDRTPFERDFSINYLIEAFDELYDLKVTGGPIFELYMRNALSLLMEQPGTERYTVLDVPRVFQDRTFRRKLIASAPNAFVRNFWEKEAQKSSGEVSLENVAVYITSKFCRFVYNDIMRGIIGQRRSTIDFRTALDEGKILLIDLRKGLLGATNSYFLGMILAAKIFAAALSRSSGGRKSQPPPFYLYVDEFQNIATPTFVSMLSEARKYGLGLNLTNQYFSQLKPDIINGILGNVATLVSFRVGSRDAELLSGEFAGIISKSDLVGLSNWHAYVRLPIDGTVSAPFNIRTILPQAGGVSGAPVAISRLSREKYGRNRKDLEKELQESWEIEARDEK